MDTAPSSAADGQQGDTWLARSCWRFPPPSHCPRWSLPLSPPPSAEPGRAEEGLVVLAGLPVPSPWLCPWCLPTIRALREETWRKREQERAGSLTSAQLASPHAGGCLPQSQPHTGHPLNLPGFFTCGHSVHHPPLAWQSWGRGVCAQAQRDGGRCWGSEGEPTATNPKLHQHLVAVSRVSGHGRIQQQDTGGTLGAKPGGDGY